MAHEVNEAIEKLKDLKLDLDAKFKEFQVRSVLR